MDYKKSFKQIMRQLAAYKADIDSLASMYLEESRKHEEELRGMAGVYTEEYINESRKNWKPKMDYGKDICTLRTKYQKTADVYFNRIKKEIDHYFCVPVDSGFSATISAIKATGAVLSNREFELLQNASNGYWGRRLLSELAVNRTVKSVKTELGENNEPELNGMDRPVPFGGVKLPDIESVYGALQGVKDSVSMAFSGYCGASYELRDFVFPADGTQAETAGKFKEEYGIEPPKKKPDTMIIVKMAGSVQCFDENYAPYTVLLA